MVHGGIHPTANVPIRELRDRLAELKAEDE